MTTVTVTDDSYSVPRSYISSIRKKPKLSPPAGNFLSKQQVSATLSTNENGWLNAPSFSATHFTWKISFPTSFSLTGSWTTTQKLLIGWIEIDSFYPWVPGAQKKPGEKFPTLLRIWWCIWKTGGKWFRWKKCTKNMKRDGNSLAKHDNVILDVHPSSIIKKSLWKWTIAPQICGNWLN